MRLKFPRESYIPKPSARVADKHSSAVVYLWTSGRSGRPGATGFHGKAQKPDFQYVYRNEQHRAEEIAQFFANIRGHEQRVRDNRQKRREFRHTLQIGNVLDSSWGYEQTNVDFYQVVATTEHTVTVRPLKQTRVPGSGLSHGMAQYVMPIPDEFLGEKSYTCRVRPGNSITVDGHYADLWDGNHKYSSWYH